MITINCDIGERGADHPVDVELMRHIDIANIACGGHAGDSASIAAFRELASETGAEVAAHLSYPDRASFGRTSMAIGRAELWDSLNDQYAVMADVRTVKFHGALYNDTARDEALADTIAEWLRTNGIRRILAPPVSRIAKVCWERGIDVLREGFAERNYRYDVATRELRLVDRSCEHAVISDSDIALEHSRRMIEDRVVLAYDGSDSHDPDILTVGAEHRRRVPLSIDTLCIHSDSTIALDLAVKLKVLLHDLDS